MTCPERIAFSWELVGIAVGGLSRSHGVGQRDGHLVVCQPILSSTGYSTLEM